MKKILVCIDGSDYSKTCCEYAIWFAKQTNAFLDVLYVSDLRPFEMSLIADFSASIGLQPYEGLYSHLKEVEVEKVKTMEIFVTDIFKKAGMVGRFRFHNVPGVLVEYLEDIDDHFPETDLVLLGKRGESFQTAVGHLGSQMERVVRSLVKPCFVCPQEFQEIKKVLIAYDGSEHCEHAVSFIIRNEEFKNYDLHLLTVEGNNSEDITRDIAKKAEDRLREAGFNPTCEVVIGDPEERICDYIENQDFDLVIVGAYGHSRIRELIIGSTTTHILQRSHIPVMMFR